MIKVTTTTGMTIEFDDYHDFDKYMRPKAQRGSVDPSVVGNSVFNGAAHKASMEQAQRDIAKNTQFILDGYKKTLTKVSS